MKLNGSQETGDNSPHEGLSRTRIFPSPHKRLYKAFLNKDVVDQACDRYAEKSYAEAYLLKKRLAQFAGIILQIFSGFLAFFAVFKLLGYLVPTFPYQPLLVAIVAAVVLVLLEVAKRIIWNELFAEKLKSDKWVLSSVIISLVLFGLSAGSSTVGCYQLTWAMADSTAVLTKRAQVDSRQLESQYDQKIQDYRQAMKQLEKQVQKQVQEGMFLTAPPAEEAKLKFYASQIDKLQNEKNRKTERLDQTTQTKTTDIQQTARQYALAGFGISALFEVLALVCIGYLAYFDFRVYLEERSRAQALQPKVQAVAKTDNSALSLHQMMDFFKQLNSFAEHIPPWVLQGGLPTGGAAQIKAANQEKLYEHNTIGFRLEQTPTKNKVEQPKTTPVVMQTAVAKADQTPKMFKVTCKKCGKKTVKKSPQAKFCSDNCRKSYHKK